MVSTPSYPSWLLNLEAAEDLSRKPGLGLAMTTLLQSKHRQCKSAGYSTAVFDSPSHLRDLSVLVVAPQRHVQRCMRSVGRDIRCQEVQP